jgi:hypothetical protein
MAAGRGYEFCSELCSATAQQGQLPRPFAILSWVERRPFSVDGLWRTLLVPTDETNSGIPPLPRPCRIRKTDAFATSVSERLSAFQLPCESDIVAAKTERQQGQMSAIKVADYDPAWPGLFEEQRRRIMELIGDMVEGIHHVGGTSIAGLCAKPKRALSGTGRISSALCRIAVANCD